MTKHDADGYDGEPPMVIAAKGMFDANVHCESCEWHIKVGQRIQRWSDGVRTHYECSDRSIAVAN